MPLSTEQLPALLDALPDPLFVLSESGRYLGVYGGSDTGFYHDGRHLVGQTLQAIMPAEKAAAILEQIATSLEEGRLLKVEYPLAASEVKGLEEADGPDDIIWFEGHVQPFPGRIDGERAVIWIARNISERRALEQKLREASLMDPLTHTFNRRKLIEELGRRFEERRRYGEPSAVLMLDVDHFKQINDRHGHSMGDEVLRALAETCRGQLRAGDLLTRFGGEEFVILLPHVEAPRAQEIAERLREEVARSEPRITVSIGVSEIREGDPHFEAALKRADDALYEAKRAGRNRVVVN